MVFQDPLGALDPRRTVLDAVTEPLRPLRLPAASRAQATGCSSARASTPGSSPATRTSSRAGRPSVRIARALVADGLIVFDEPTSALDVTVQARSSTSSAS